MIDEWVFENGSRVVSQQRNEGPSLSQFLIKSLSLRQLYAEEQEMSV